MEHNGDFIQHDWNFTKHDMNFYLEKLRRFTVVWESIVCINIEGLSSSLMMGKMVKDSLLLNHIGQLTLLRAEQRFRYNTESRGVRATSWWSAIWSTSGWKIGITWGHLHLYLPKFATSLSLKYIPPILHSFTK